MSKDLESNIPPQKIFDNTPPEAYRYRGSLSTSGSLFWNRKYNIRPVCTTNGSRGTVAGLGPTTQKRRLYHGVRMAYNTNAGRRRPNILTCGVSGRAHRDVDDVQRTGMCDGATKPAAGPWRESFEHRV